ncbi:MAG: D-glycero-beta-D-manno-heptose 1,7-bisphosphate 7-phosphatase [Duodenibacillus sp.]|nr:D-glycero-beta-D-manno-heptose 1,7-bisphosphate 7-phosphatase [Duodenibacillus sp.]
MIRAAFLDRDGVINVDRAYVHRLEDFELVEGVLEAARALVEKGYALVVVTNQSGIGRGYYGAGDFERLTEAMKAMFARAGAPIAAVYHCPHHPDKALPPWRVACGCRKPAPGMLLRAAEELGVDLAASVMFGDKRGDMQAAAAAGVPRRILLGTDGAAVPEPVPECTAVARSLSEGAALL